MSSIAIKVENLSKAYQLGEIGTGTISRDLERWFARIRGKEDPFLSIAQTNHTSKMGSDVVWSLKDINFEIAQGDAVGIIGRNGAGKSTLLKILSRVTSPTSGRIIGKGRIASLLEVGTGFHPDLTGRENIYLNGAILGMRKKEISQKFDEIVDFAGVERYIDTPVRRYSSGMYVRLAFAVAAHLESEILIVDEVLAVGDLEFQKKCLGKMSNISQTEGRTVLFVSHDMSSIKSLCKKSILLKNGTLNSYSNSAAVIQTYLQDKETRPRVTGTREITVSGLYIKDNNENLLQQVAANAEVTFVLKVTCKVPLTQVSFALCFNNAHKVRACSLWTNFTEKNYDIAAGEYEIAYHVPSLKLVPGIYEIVTYIERKNNVIERIDDFGQLTVKMNETLRKQLVTPQLYTGVYQQDFNTTVAKLT